VNNEATIRTRGRVTIPSAIRKIIKAKPGEKLVFLEKDGMFVLTTRKRTARGSSKRKSKVS
jgi:AbrB family looped-hinge helix DNA binding protein